MVREESSANQRPSEIGVLGRTEGAEVALMNSMMKIYCGSMAAVACPVTQRTHLILSDPTTRPSHFALVLPKDFDRHLFDSKARICFTSVYL